MYQSESGVYHENETRVKKKKVQQEQSEVYCVSKKQQLT